MEKSEINFDEILCSLQKHNNYTALFTYLTETRSLLNQYYSIINPDYAAEKDSNAAKLTEGLKLIETITAYARSTSKNRTSDKIPAYLASFEYFNFDFDRINTFSDTLKNDEQRLHYWQWILMMAQTISGMKTLFPNRTIDIEVNTIISYSALRIEEFQRKLLIEDENNKLFLKTEPTEQNMEATTRRQTLFMNYLFAAAGAKEVNNKNKIEIIKFLTGKNIDEIRKNLDKSDRIEVFAKGLTPRKRKMLLNDIEYVEKLFKKLNLTRTIENIHYDIDDIANHDD